MQKVLTLICDQAAQEAKTLRLDRLFGSMRYCKASQNEVKVKGGEIARQCQAKLVKTLRFDRFLKIMS